MKRFSLNALMRPFSAAILTLGASGIAAAADGVQIYGVADMYVAVNNDGGRSERRRQRFARRPHRNRTDL